MRVWLEHNNTQIHSFIHAVCPDCVYSSNLITLPQIHHYSQTVTDEWLFGSVDQFVLSSESDTVNCSEPNSNCKQNCASLCSPSCLNPCCSPSREAISLVCEAIPGTKGGLRKRKVHEMERSLCWSDEQREKTRVAGSYSGGEQEETSLDIQLPLRVLFIACPLQRALSSAFYCLKRERERGRTTEWLYLEKRGWGAWREMKRYRPARVWV